jgi:hypothetical protein
MTSKKLVVTVLMLTAVSSTARALGNTPFRLEGAYISPSWFQVSGMVDITRWLTARVGLADVSWYPDFRVNVLYPQHKVPCLILSPWRGRRGIQPYLYAGLGMDVRRKVSSEFRYAASFLMANCGLGVENLLFFLPHAPSLCFEAGQYLVAGHFWSPPPEQPWFKYPRFYPQITVGLRI